MKAIILSAGQGRRLLPKTAHAPKCALSIAGKSIVERQIDTLLAAGIDSVTVVVGYGADHVRHLLDKRYDPAQVKAVYNPLFQVADNLVTCWVVRREMNEDFILLNGDTLFEPAVLSRLLDSPSQPITLATNVKPCYDADDMKVRLDDTRLVRIGKDLPLNQVDAESIGMIRFQGKGPGDFRDALERAMNRPEAFKQWYLSVIDTMALTRQIHTQSMQGLGWTEIDDLEDLARAQRLVAHWDRRNGSMSIPALQVLPGGGPHRLPLEIQAQK
jgi:choline kinase